MLVYLLIENLYGLVIKFRDVGVLREAVSDVGLPLS